jgi:hypothetical protein
MIIERGILSLLVKGPLEATMRFPIVCSCAAALAFVITCAPAARGVTPESPEVKAVIEKGLNFLEKASDERLGGKCLIGLAFLKNGRELNHPKVVGALEACKASAGSAGSQDMYSNGIALIFLCEHDPQKNKTEIEAYLKALLNRQMQHGGFGYAGTPTGDTSQTQYAALGLWMAQRNGYRVPLTATEKMCGWLLRTQDPSGAWGYQGVDPGNLQRVPQNDIRPSLAAAGLGSVYICADLLEIIDPQKPKADSGQPPALKVVEKESPRSKRGDGISRVIDASTVRRSMADGNNWFQRNFTLKTQSWNYYYLYGLERYLSYRELAQVQVEREPGWYNEMFLFLQRQQKVDGSWASQSEEGGGAAVDTCFAVLALSRSSKKAIQKVVKNLGEGTLLGGMGLPPNTADLQERDGKLVTTPLAGSVDELLAIIDDPKNKDLTGLSETTGLALDPDITKRTSQLQRLRELVRAESFEPRLVAVKTLGKVRDLDNVPMLLYALTDPDIRVVREADKALRFISRKFAGVGSLDEPNPQNLQAVRDAWKTWLLSVRPDAELLD